MNRLSRVLLVLSVIAFGGGWAGLIYYRWIEPTDNLTAAWTNALSAFGGFSIIAIFLAVVAVYAAVQARQISQP